MQAPQLMTPFEKARWLAKRGNKNRAGADKEQHRRQQKPESKGAGSSGARSKGAGSKGAGSKVAPMRGSVASGSRRQISQGEDKGEAQEGGTADKGKEGSTAEREPADEKTDSSVIARVASKIQSWLPQSSDRHDE